MTRWAGSERIARSSQARVPGAGVRSTGGSFGRSIGAGCTGGFASPFWLCTVRPWRLERWRRGAPAEQEAPRHNPPPGRQRARAPERTQAASCRPPPEAVAEEAARGSAVGVPVVRDVPHVVVHPELPELLRGDFRQTLAHVRDVLVGGRGPVIPPDHHGHLAD